LTMLSIGILAALTVSTPWLTLTIMIILYIVTLLFSPHSFKKLEREASAKVSEDENT